MDDAEKTRLLVRALQTVWLRPVGDEPPQPFRVFCRWAHQMQERDRSGVELLAGVNESSDSAWCAAIAQYPHPDGHLNEQNGESGA